jgi:polar amino acid transport system permease protein
VLAAVLGVVFAVASLRSKAAERFVLVYVEAMRNSPSLVKLFFIYFGLPEFGIFLSPWMAGVLALGLHNAGYMTEALRGAIASVPAAQVNAARALGMSEVQVQRIVVLPQALRIAVPALTNTSVEMVKDTALTSAIAVQELTHLMQSLISATMRAAEFLIAFSAIYLVLTASVAAMSKAVEARMRW